MIDFPEREREREEREEILMMKRRTWLVLGSLNYRYKQSGNKEKRHLSERCVTREVENGKEGGKGGR